MSCHVHIRNVIRYMVYGIYIHTLHYILVLCIIHIKNSSNEATSVHAVADKTITSSSTTIHIRSTPIKTPIHSFIHKMNINTKTSPGELSLSFPSRESEG